MALSEEGGIPATMLVGPTSYGPGYQGGFGGGFGDGNGWWILLLFLLLIGGGWNNGGNGMFTQGEAPAVQRGFDQASVMSGINGISSGVQGIATQICNSSADITQAITGGFANAETAANARQMANMNQAFAAQTAMAQGFNALGSQFADCCCENRLASADLKYTIATENCADRYEAAQNTRDIIENANRNNQAIIDKLCQLELDGKNDRIADLERQLTMANLAASQTAQTAQIRAGQVAEIDAMYNRLRDCPVPTMPVYGSQPIFTCGGNTGCGCGNGF